jgi:hypothetical protein
MPFKPQTYHSVGEVDFLRPARLRVNEIIVRHQNNIGLLLAVSAQVVGAGLGVGGKGKNDKS